VNRVIDEAVTVNFISSDAVLDSGGRFEFMLSPQALVSDINLVIDIYDIANPVHPEGHIGWWQYSIDDLPALVDGTITVDSGKMHCDIAAGKLIGQWLNEEDVPCDHMIVNVVLRHNITNAIVYLDKLPVFTKSSDLADYRVGFNLDWDVPQYASAYFVSPDSCTVRIVARNIYPRDAVGNLCLDLYKMLQQNGISVRLYAENFDLGFNEHIHRYTRLLHDVQPEDQLLYFYSTYDPALESVMGVNVERSIAYYHGVTKPELLQVFDLELSVTCKKAFHQVSKLQEFNYLASNSKAAARVMVSEFGDETSWSVDDIKIIGPRLLDSKNSSLVAESGRNEATTLLYVGRISSHKKLEHLLELLDALLKLDDTAELWIVGGGGGKAYLDYLNWVETGQLELPADKVHWFGSVSEDRLRELYVTATAYVSMSEDEGFCLPVLEAMLAGLPVFAYGLPAVREVLGGSGVYFLEKDYDRLASRIYELTNDSDRLNELIQRQFVSAMQLAGSMDGRGFLDLFQPSAE